MNNAIQICNGFLANKYIIIIEVFGNKMRKQNSQFIKSNSYYIIILFLNILAYTYTFPPRKEAWIKFIIGADVSVFQISFPLIQLMCFWMRQNVALTQCMNFYQITRAKYKMKSREQQPLPKCPNFLSTSLLVLLLSQQGAVLNASSLFCFSCLFLHVSSW